MSLAASLLLYLLPGAAVAWGVRRRGQAAFAVLSALVFWPLFVPQLLGGPPAEGACSHSNDPLPPPP
jgi:hypothetical protein